MTMDAVFQCMRNDDTPKPVEKPNPREFNNPAGSLVTFHRASNAPRSKIRRALLEAQQCLISLNETPQHSPDPLSDDLRCHRFCPRCPRQPPTMASFFPTADVANSRFDNDLSEDLIRGSPLWISPAQQPGGGEMLPSP